MAAERKLFNLRSAVVISFAVKFGILLLGVAIMGFTQSRTQLTVCGSTSPGNPAIYSAPFGDVEAYTDYRDLYLRCLVNPFLGGKSAYNLPIVYNYPPPFLYLLSAASFLLSYIWSAAIPLVLFDALTVIPVYLLAKDFLFRGSSKPAFAVALLWIFNPINLFYNDLMWLNTGPTTFFLVFSIYFLLKKNYTLSSVFLGISTSLKQTAILLFPIFLIWMLRSSTFPRKKIPCILYSLRCHPRYHLYPVSLSKPPIVPLGTAIADSRKSPGDIGKYSYDFCLRSFSAYETHNFYRPRTVRQFDFLGR